LWLFGNDAHEKCAVGTGATCGAAVAVRHAARPAARLRQPSDSPLCAFFKTGRAGAAGGG
jgi:hypothetical protein